MGGVPGLFVLLLLFPAGVGLLAVARRRSHLNAVAAGVATGTLLGGLLLTGEVLAVGQVQYAGGLLSLDDLSGVLVLVVGLVGAAALLYSVDYLGRAASPHEATFSDLRRYYALVFLFLWTMFLVAASNNLGLLWIALEGTTLVSALLVGFYPTRRAQEASWKYLILCSVGLAFALFGTLLLYLASVRALGPGGNGLDWTNLAANGARLDPGLVGLAVVFLFVGYGTKAGLAPLHTWLPDAHSESPTPVSALLSGALLNCAIYALLRIDAITLRIPGFTLANWLFLLFGFFSVFLAALFIFVQRDLKRLLAYSSVENMGIICLGVAFGGAAGMFAALFQMLNHATTKAGLFLVGGNLALAAQTKNLQEIQGTLTATSGLGVLLLIGGLGLAGVPPFAVFSSEFLILSAGVAGGDPWGAGLLLVALALVFAGLSLHLTRVLLGRPPEERFRGGFAWGVGSSLGIGVLFALAIGLGLVIPNPLSQLLHGAAQVVSG